MSHSMTSHRPNSRCASADCTCREHIGVVHPKSTGERPESSGRISGRDYDPLAFDGSPTGPQPDALAIGHDPPYLRPLEHLRARGRGRAHHAKTRAIRIELRTAMRANRAATREAGTLPQRAWS